MNNSKRILNVMLIITMVLYFVGSFTAFAASKTVTTKPVVKITTLAKTYKLGTKVTVKITSPNVAFVVYTVSVKDTKTKKVTVIAKAKKVTGKSGLSLNLSTKTVGTYTLSIVAKTFAGTAKAQTVIGKSYDVNGKVVASNKSTPIVGKGLTDTQVQQYLADAKKAVKGKVTSSVKITTPAQAISLVKAIATDIKTTTSNIPNLDVIIADETASQKAILDTIAAKPSSIEAELSSVEPVSFNATDYALTLAGDLDAEKQAQNLKIAMDTLNIAITDINSAIKNAYVIINNDGGVVDGAAITDDTNFNLASAISSIDFYTNTFSKTVAKFISSGINFNTNTHSNTENYIYAAKILTQNIKNITLDMTNNIKAYDSYHITMHSTVSDTSTVMSNIDKSLLMLKKIKTEYSSRGLATSGILYNTIESLLKKTELVTNLNLSENTLKLSDSLNNSNIIRQLSEVCLTNDMLGVSSGYYFYTTKEQESSFLSTEIVDAMSIANSNYTDVLTLMSNFSNIKNSIYSIGLNPVFDNSFTILSKYKADYDTILNAVSKTTDIETLSVMSGNLNALNYRYKTDSTYVKHLISDLCSTYSAYAVDKCIAIVSLSTNTFSYLSDIDVVSAESHVTVKTSTKELMSVLTTIRNTHSISLNLQNEVTRLTLIKDTFTKVYSNYASSMKTVILTISDENLKEFYLEQLTVISSYEKSLETIDTYSNLILN